LSWLSSTYFYYKFSIFLADYFASFNLWDMFWFSCWTLFNCPLTVTSSSSRFFKVLYTISSYRLEVCRRLWVLDILSLTCSNSTLRFDNFYNVLDQIVAFWATCFKNMLIMSKRLCGMTRNLNKFKSEKL